MNTPHYLPAVREYAEAVRAALTGLSPADVADITDGLEADLVAALEDEFPATDDGDGSDHERVLTAAMMAERFGPPEDYVRELRQAAGLDDPPPTPRGRRARRAARREGEALGGVPRPRRRPVRRAVRGAARRVRTVVRYLRATSWWPGAAAAGRVAAPAWWVIRAWAAMAALTWVVFPDTITELALFAGFLAASLLLGHVRWAAQTKPLRVIMAGVNGILVIATIGAWGHATSGVDTAPPAEIIAMDDATDPMCASPDAPLCAGGEPVTDIFAYDGDGNPIDLVQLFDAEGRPLRVVVEDDYLNSSRYMEWQSEDVDPTTGELRSVTWSNLALVMDGTNRPVWNAYPIRTRMETEYMATGARTVGPDIVPPFPLRLAPALTTNDAEDTLPSEEPRAEDSPAPEDFDEGEVTREDGGTLEDSDEYWLEPDEPEEDTPAMGEPAGPTPSQSRATPAPTTPARSTPARSTPARSTPAR
ncbi:MAG: hypothetical protein LBK72_00100, partial [Bifidobacteriaceae bacterium]|nr:hypothetical protein [Bifidobacteriaceae bacterium]